MKIEKRERGGGGRKERKREIIKRRKRRAKEANVADRKLFLTVIISD